jgi:hypothetical protein
MSPVLPSSTTITVNLPTDIKTLTKRRFLLDHYIIIPNHIYQSMIQTGMVEQINQLVENMDSETIQSLQAKCLHDDNDNNHDNDMEKKVKCRRIQRDVSSQTTIDFLHIALDSEEDEAEYLPIVLDSDEDEF